MSFVIVISGPSGAGKNSVIQGVLKNIDSITYVPSCTTRSMRKNEEQGKPYIFVSGSEFDNLVDAGEFIEYRDNYGNMYGSLRKKYEEKLGSGFSIIKDIDVQGGIKFLETFKERTIMIYLTVSTVGELESRLLSRNDTENIENRLKEFESENAVAQGNYEHIIYNNVLSETIEKVTSIITERLTRVSALI